MLKDYINLINKVTNKSPIFYVSNNAERALGVEDILSNYIIINSESNYITNLLKEKGVNIYSSENSTIKNSLDLIKDLNVKNFITSHSRDNANLMFFRISKAIKKASVGYNVLNPDPYISTEIENKIYQYEKLSNSEFKNYLPKTIIKRINEVNYESISEFLGTSFVIQFDIGHAGNSTFFINDKAQFNEFVLKYKETNMKMKFSELLNYNFITLNGVATRYGSYIAGLSNQITGLRELNALKGETCGTNWNQIGITTDIRKEAVDLTSNIGKYLYEIGFKGFFGIDIAIHNNQLYILEINSRQTASVQYHTKLQLENNQIPLWIINLMEFLNIEFSIDVEQYNYENNLPIDASTLIVRNHFEKEIELNSTYNGIYNLEDLKFEEDSYSINDIYSKSKVLILEQTTGKNIKPNEEFLKIITKGNILKDLNSLDDNISITLGKILKDINIHEN